MTSATSSTSSISGLASGMDTSSIITQLMQIEAQPQTLLKNRLAETQTQGAAYRKINTAMASLSSAAQALTGTGMTSARKASSTSSTAAASAGTTAVPGSSVTFTVDKLAAAQTTISAGVWSSATGDVTTASANPTTLPTWPLTVKKADGTTDTIAIPAGGSLNDAAAAINKSPLGLSATVVQLDSSHFKLQVTSNTTGAAGAFELLAPGETGNATYAAPGAAFTNTTTAADATLTLSSGDRATSSTNTFNELLTGVSVTVSALSPVPSAGPPATPTTISVSNDTSAVTAKVKAMMDAANAALKAISDNTDSSDGSDAVLKGNWTLTSLAGKILDQVSAAVGGDPTAADGTPARIGYSPAQVGIQLDRNGAIVFDSAKFASALAADPSLAQKIVGGKTLAGADNVANTPDDTIDVDGLAARLSVLAEQASDKTTGMITSLANSEDAQAKDIQSQIDAWTLRLQQRQATMTAQFNAMETALGTLKNQSSWLSSQIASLPTWSSSKS